MKQIFKAFCIFVLFIILHMNIYAIFGLNLYSDTWADPYAILASFIALVIGMIMVHWMSDSL